jgi:hypothetical protein
MQAQVGDELTVKGHHQGDEDHHGEIIEVIGADGAPPYMVRWRNGFESLFYIRPRPASATAHDRVPDTRGRALFTHHPSGDGTGDAPSALAPVSAVAAEVATIGQVGAGSRQEVPKVPHLRPWL